MTPPDMTLDDQIRRMAPLKGTLLARLAGYRAGGNQISSMRAAGRPIPPHRLRDVAADLRRLAAEAEAMAGEMEREREAA